jgi:hypothetical protein
MFSVPDPPELGVELGGGVVGVAVIVVFGGFVQLFQEDVSDVGLSKDLQRLQSVTEHSCGGKETEVALPFGAAAFIACPLDEKHEDEEGRKGREGPEEHEVEVHEDPFRADGSQTWIGAPMKTAAMVSIAEGSGL